MSAGRMPLERKHTEGIGCGRADSVEWTFSSPLLSDACHSSGALQPDILHIDEEPYNLATYHAARGNATA